MLKCNKVAVTGGLSSGKTTVCRFFKELGAYVVSADEIVHQLLSPESLIGHRVVELLGQDIVVDKQIDRSKIAHKVFGNAKLLQSLEHIIHPAVRDEIERQFSTVQQQGSFSLFVAEIPLLFESADSYTFDYIIAVVADPAISFERFKKKTGYEKKEYQNRAARQLENHEKAQKADFVIRNNGSLESLRNAVVDIYKKIASQ